jgi:hypothetical protein
MKFKLGQQVVVLADWSESKGQIGCYIAEVRDDEGLYLIKWQGHKIGEEYNACLCQSCELAPYEGIKAPDNQPVSNGCFEKLDIRSQYRLIIESTMSCMITLQKLLEDGVIDLETIFEKEGYPFYCLAEYVDDMVMDFEHTYCGKAECEDDFEDFSKKYFKEKLIEALAGGEN